MERLTLSPCDIRWVASQIANGVVHHRLEWSTGCSIRQIRDGASKRDVKAGRQVRVADTICDPVQIANDRLGLSRFAVASDRNSLDDSIPPALDDVKARSIFVEGHAVCKVERPRIPEVALAVSRSKR